MQNNYKIVQNSRSSQRRCSIKKLFFKISQYSQENTVLDSLLIKKRLQHWCFPVNISKFLRTPILNNIWFENQIFWYPSAQLKNETTLEMDRTSQRGNEEQTLKNILTRFAENTTAHGYAHIVNSSHKYLKVFWLVALISCHAYVIRNINILVRQYLEKSVTTSVHFENEFSPSFSSYSNLQWKQV